MGTVTMSSPIYGVLIVIILIAVLSNADPEQVLEASSGCPKFANCKCRRNLDPWCGSNGVTYNNKCLFMCSKRNCPGMEETRARRGDCGISSADTSPPPKKNLGKKKKKKKKKKK